MSLQVFLFRIYYLISHWQWIEISLLVVLLSLFWFLVSMPKCIITSAFRSGGQEYSGSWVCMSWHATIASQLSAAMPPQNLCNTLVQLRISLTSLLSLHWCNTCKHHLKRKNLWTNLKIYFYLLVKYFSFIFFETFFNLTS